MDRATANGGFPLPADSEPARTVRARHAECGTETRVRLPRVLPARAVRRVVCERCSVPFEATARDERRLLGAGLAWPRAAGRDGARRWATLALAGGLVVGGLLLIQGGDSGTPAGDPQAPAERAAEAGTAEVVDTTGGGRGDRSGDARLVSEATFTLALPAGWKRVPAEGGATFAAVAPGGEADATLWVERDAELDFATFEARSLGQLEQLAGSAEVVERTAGPTPQATIVRIAADAPAGAPRYEALLRAGPDGYWYYLATTVQPDASADALNGLELIRGSLIPEGAAGR